MFYDSYRWRLLRRFMLWLYGAKCMRCGSTHHIEVDHIIARARLNAPRSPFRVSQWSPRNLQVLCHECNRGKMVNFADYRPLWARVMMRVRDLRR